MLVIMVSLSNNTINICSLNTNKTILVYQSKKVNIDPSYIYIIEGVQIIHEFQVTLISRFKKQLFIKIRNLLYTVSCWKF